MDGSDRSRISSSTPIKRSSTPKSSSSATGTDENDLSYQQTGISLQNSKKPMTKRFMSPTTSASSKAIAPRKEVLAEANEISDNSEGSLSVNVDSCLSPYDPLPNYPSPRPKFLRYKPNRRREIVLSCGNEAKGSISLPCKKEGKADLVCLSQEGEEIDKGEEEVEEEEEEKEGFLRRVLKLMLVLAVLVSSTMYISLMNSPEASPTLQPVGGFKDGYLKIHDRVYGALRRLGGEDHLLKIKGFREILKKFEIGNEFFDIHMGGLVTVNQTVIFGKCLEEEMVKDFHMGVVEETSDNLIEVVELKIGDREIADEKKGGDDDLPEMAGLEAGERERVSDHGTTKTEEVSDQMFDNFELKETESIDKLESLLDDQMPRVSIAFDQEKEQVMEPVLEVNSAEDGAGEMVEIGMTNIENDMAGEVSMTERVENEISSFETLYFEEAEGGLKEGLVEPVETDIMFKSVIRVAMVLAIIAPLVFAFHLKGKWNATKDSSPIIKVWPGVAEREGHIKPFVSPPIPISLINSTMEDPKDIIQSRAPAVELLGEFVVGEVSSSFIRNRARKSKIEESEVSNNYSVSLDKGFGGSKPHSSVLYHAPLDFSELSATNISPSQEEFTPQKKKMKKEDGRDGEAKNVSITPVRRSSRIRNRAITSP